MFVRQPTDNLKGNYIDFSVKMSEKQAKQMIVFKIRFGMGFFSPFSVINYEMTALFLTRPSILGLGPARCCQMRHFRLLDYQIWQYPACTGVACNAVRSQLGFV